MARSRFSSKKLWHYFVLWLLVWSSLVLPVIGFIQGARGRNLGKEEKEPRLRRKPGPPPPGVRAKFIAQIKEQQKQLEAKHQVCLPQEEPLSHVEATLSMRDAFDKAFQAARSPRLEDFDAPYFVRKIFQSFASLRYQHPYGDEIILLTQQLRKFQYDKEADAKMFEQLSDYVRYQSEKKISPMFDYVLDLTQASFYSNLNETRSLESAVSIDRGDLALQEALVKNPKALGLGFILPRLKNVMAGAEGYIAIWQRLQDYFIRPEQYPFISLLGYVKALSMCSQESAMQFFSEYIAPYMEQMPNLVSQEALFLFIQNKDEKINFQDGLFSVGAYCLSEETKGMLESHQGFYVGLASQLEKLVQEKFYQKILNSGKELTSSYQKLDAHFLHKSELFDAYILAAEGRRRAAAVIHIPESVFSCFEQSAKTTDDVLQYIGICFYALQSNNKRNAQFLEDFASFYIPQRFSALPKEGKLFVKLMHFQAAVWRQKGDVAVQYLLEAMQIDGQAMEILYRLKSNTNILLSLRQGKLSDSEVESMGKEIKTILAPAEAALDINQQILVQLNVLSMLSPIKTLEFFEQSIWPVMKNSPSYHQIYAHLLNQAEKAATEANDLKRLVLSTFPVLPWPLNPQKETAVSFEALDKIISTFVEKNAPGLKSKQEMDEQAQQYFFSVLQGSVSVSLEERHRLAVDYALNAVLAGEESSLVKGILLNFYLANHQYDALVALLNNYMVDDKTLAAIHAFKNPELYTFQPDLTIQPSVASEDLSYLRIALCDKIGDRSDLNADACWSVHALLSRSNNNFDKVYYVKRLLETGRYDRANDFVQKIPLSQDFVQMFYEHVVPASYQQEASMRLAIENYLREKKYELYTLFSHYFNFEEIKARKEQEALLARKAAQAEEVTKIEQERSATQRVIMMLSQEYERTKLEVAALRQALDKAETWGQGESGRILEMRQTFETKAIEYKEKIAALENKLKFESESIKDCRKQYFKTKVRLDISEERSRMLRILTVLAPSITLTLGAAVTFLIMRLPSNNAAAQGGRQPAKRLTHHASTSTDKLLNANLALCLVYLYQAGLGSKENIRVINKSHRYARELADTFALLIRSSARKLTFKAVLNCLVPTRSFSELEAKNILEDINGITHPLAYLLMAQIAWGEIGFAFHDRYAALECLNYISKDSVIYPLALRLKLDMSLSGLDIMPDLSFRGIAKRAKIDKRLALEREALSAELMPYDRLGEVYLKRYSIFKHNSPFSVYEHEVVAHRREQAGYPRYDYRGMSNEELYEKMLDAKLFFSAAQVEEYAAKAKRFSPEKFRAAIDWLRGEQQKTATLAGPAPR
ncbi:MAG: hypothetical protein K0S08_2154 [Gammaproteobacteria bacterium]|jgi:hypothetical protein|nr:hypothetical protein [Gammaproteobacteria bacterium]